MKGLQKYLENRKEGCDPSGRAILDQWITSLQILEAKAKAYDEVKAERDIAFLQLKELGTTFGEKPELAKERLWEEQRQIQERLSVVGTVFQEKGSNHTYRTYYDKETADAQADTMFLKGSNGHYLVNDSRLADRMANLLQADSLAIYNEMSQVPNGAFKDAVVGLCVKAEQLQTKETVYGVEQSNHGHNYRWIFDKKTLEDHGIDVPKAEDDISSATYDIGFPIGGSNSSATYITELDSTDKVKDFLLSEYYTDLEDPTLVDIAEGICTIDVGDESITRRYVKEFQIPDEMMTRENGYVADAKYMIQALQEQGVDCDLDYDNPFYGSSKDMRLSELQDLYDVYIKNPELGEVNDEVEEPELE